MEEENYEMITLDNQCYNVTSRDKPQNPSASEKQVPSIDKPQNPSTYENLKSQYTMPACSWMCAILLVGFILVGSAAFISLGLIQSNISRSLDSKLNNVIRSLTGQYLSLPADLCSHVLQLNPFSPSDHYWIRSSNGSAVHVYCDMTRSCGNITGGWMRVASLNWSNESLPCPD